MLDFFSKRLLPGEDPWTPIVAEDTDIASYNDLWLAADLIETCCLVVDKHPGWTSAGRYSFLLNVIH